MPESFYDPYFDRWNCVLVLADPKNMNSGQFKLQHKTCAGFVDIPVDLKGNKLAPPKTCEVCGADCVKEAKDEEIMKRHGAVMLGAPEKKITPHPLTFKPKT